ncbi:hypothetical protein TNCV_1694181 [Trichonephila clavipes]|nr:hypothetical protein TNCV_1694181 [Trichonephila clavipes]
MPYRKTGDLLNKSCIKTMFITFFDSQGIIIYKVLFLPEGTKTKAARYIEILIRFMKRLHSVRPSTHNKDNGLLFMTMLALTQPMSSNSSWQKKGERLQIERPPFSPNINPPDFFQFPRLKLALKGKRLDDIFDIQRNVTRLLNFISKENFLKSFQDMYSRSIRVQV